jgi:DNA-binding GntR family transcriptional regulator
LGYICLEAGETPPAGQDRSHATAFQHRQPADDLAHELQVEIITGRIPLGTRLRQEDLAERFGVSRTPIREALRQLQAIGLVEQLGHRGALVRSFSPDECRNIFLVRAELEGLAAERASGRLTTYDHADLDTAQALLRAGPQVKILATSRELLHVAGEMTYSVPPLAVPDPRQVTTVAALLMYFGTAQKRVTKLKP